MAQITDKPTPARSVGEATLWALVICGIAHHLAWQTTLPATFNESWAGLAACLPWSLSEKLTMSAGFTTEFAWQLLFGDCTFRGWTFRVPHVIALVLALVLAAAARRDHRSLRERLLTVGFLLGTPFPLYYAHHGRQYAFLILGGLACVIYRDIAGFSWRRAVPNLVSVLSAPFGAPMWLATILVANRSNWQRDRVGIGGAIELALLAIATSWEVYLYRGPVRTVVEGTNYTLPDRLSGVSPLDLLELFGWTGPLPWAIAAATIAIIGLAGLRQHRCIVKILAAAVLMHVVGWAVLQPPLHSRYLLALTMAWPLGLASIRPTSVWGERVMIAGVSLIFFASFARFQYSSPEFYWNIESRYPLQTILQDLNDDDIFLTDLSFLTEPGYLGVIANSRARTWVVPMSAGTEWYPGNPPIRVWERLDHVYEQPWVQSRGFRLFESFPLQQLSDELASGTRVISAGLLSLPLNVCDQPCVSALVTPPNRANVIWGHPDDDDLVAYCGDRPRTIVIADEPADAAWLRAPLAPTAARHRVSVCKRKQPVQFDFSITGK